LRIRKAVVAFSHEHHHDHQPRDAGMSGAMRHRCNICGRRFKNPGAMQKHINFHREVRERFEKEHGRGSW
jgi:hypothetical protein